MNDDDGSIDWPPTEFVLLPNYTLSDLRRASHSHDDVGTDVDNDGLLCPSARLRCCAEDLAHVISNGDVILSQSVIETLIVGGVVTCGVARRHDFGCRVQAAVLATRDDKNSRQPSPVTDTP